MARLLARLFSGSSVMNSCLWKYISTSRMVDTFYLYQFWVGSPTEDGEIAKVRLIVPHGEGQSSASSNVYPCFYTITYERGKMTLIKSISGIRGTIGGKTGDTLNPLDIVKFTTAYAVFIRSHSTTQSNKIVVGRDARISGEIGQECGLRYLDGAWAMMS